MKTTLALRGFVLCAISTLFVAGCAQQQQQGRYRPEPAPAKVEVAQPAAPVATIAEGCWDLVKLTKAAPPTASVGENITYDLLLNAQCDVADVVVTDMLPDGAKYVSSEPAADAQGNTLTWRVPRMKKGETKAMRVVTTAQRVGELTSCATVTAVPITCVSTVVGKPQLEITKTGPETAQVGGEVSYSVTVKNTGSSVAKSVVVTDPVPEGLVHSGGQKELSFNVGDLAPGASKTMPVVLKADRRGKVCNVATANSSNAGKVTAQACTTIVQPGLNITKTGDKQQFLGKNASYEIVVSNTGDTVLNSVVVADTAPAGTSIVSADGASVSGNTATWNVGSLKSGEKKSFKVLLTTKTAGNYCNKVAVATAEGLKDAAEACTLWRGISGILLEKADDPDPIQVGESVTYTVKITNQGSADDSNVKMVVTFPREITPVSAQGGTVEGQTVSFPAVAKLAPKQAVSYTIKAKGANPGDARTKFTLTSAELKAPVIAEESTTVY